MREAHKITAQSLSNGQTVYIYQAITGQPEPELQMTAQELRYIVLMLRESDEVAENIRDTLKTFVRHMEEAEAKAKKEGRDGQAIAAIGLQGRNGQQLIFQFSIQDILALHDLLGRPTAERKGVANALLSALNHPDGPPAQAIQKVSAA